MPESLDSPYGKKLGGVTQSRNTVTSKQEAQVLDELRRKGLVLPRQKMAVWCRNPDVPERLAPITPDAVIIRNRIAVEVDPRFTHEHRSLQDEMRNRLLENAGWTTVRLRLGFESANSAIGPHDVVCESQSPNQSAVAALAETIEAIAANRSAPVRFIPSPRKSLAAAPTRRSRVRRLRSVERGAGHNHRFTWYPSLTEDGGLTRLRLIHGGRYLYTDERIPLFVAEVGLHTRPTEEWKQALDEVVPDCELLGTTIWPWGDSPFIVVQELSEFNELLAPDGYHDHPRHKNPTFSGRVTTDTTILFSPTVLANADGHVFAEMVPEAIELGYYISEVEVESGMFGSFATIRLGHEPRYG